MKKSRELIKEFEGFRAKPYTDSGGVWTIGYGTTKGVNKDTPVVTEAQADALLARDIASTEMAINRGVKVPLSDNQRAALISFVYNIGSGAFARSTLLRMLNNGHYEQAAWQILRWDKVKGKVVSGLVARRLKEKELFMKDMM